MTPDEIKIAVKDAIDERMSEFFVDREVHYKHHEFVGRMISWTDNISSALVSSIVKAVVGIILILLGLGVAVWLRATSK